MRSFGLLITAILSQHWGRDIPIIPGHVAAVIMAGYKGLRMTKGYKADNAIDAHAYIKFADDLAKP